MFIDCFLSTFEIFSVRIVDMNIRLERLRKMSKRCHFAMVAFGSYYVASVVCVIVVPNAPLIGRVKHEILRGGSSEVFTSVGVQRAFLQPSGEGHSLVLKIGDSQTPWQQVTVGVSLIYSIYLTLFAVVILKGLGHLRKLFSYFSRGNIFTGDTVEEINRFGGTLLMLAGVNFLGCVVVILVARMLRQPMASAVEMPLGLIFAGFLIRLVAGIFAEGQRLNEESALTI